MKASEKSAAKNFSIESFSQFLAPFVQVMCLKKNFSQPQKLLESERKAQKMSVGRAKEMLFLWIVFFRKQLKII